MHAPKRFPSGEPLECFNTERKFRQCERTFAIETARS
jgi:hypothetical protein